MSGKDKQRADILLVERGLANNRTHAQALIMSGKVLQNDIPIAKSGDRVSCDAELRIKGLVEHAWVGRGGIKLDGALKHYGIDVGGMVCVDIGASTGGFCDVLLQGGALRVYAVDVGRGQLHERIRTNERVIQLDNTNARYLSDKELPEVPDIITCDVSFISLQKALGAVLDMVESGGKGGLLIALIKPQFQLGKGDIGKGGIVKSPELHVRACDEVEAWLVGERGWVSEGIIASPITGAQGNREFFICARYGG